MTNSANKKAYVVRSPDENGDDTYRIQAGLVHKVILSILGAICAIGGYMVVWGLDDRGFKTSVASRLQDLDTRVSRQETQLSGGILPRTEERMNMLKSDDEANRKLMESEMNAINRRLDLIERDHTRRYGGRS